MRIAPAQSTSRAASNSADEPRSKPAIVPLWNAARSKWNDPADYATAEQIAAKIAKAPPALAAEARDVME